MATRGVENAVTGDMNCLGSSGGQCHEIAIYRPQSLNALKLQWNWAKNGPWIRGRNLPIEYAVHASERAATYEEFKIGLSSLATIATIAPLIGMPGTLVGIWDAPQPLGTEKMTAMANLFERLSEACVPTAAGLFVELVSLYGQRQFSGMLTRFDQEMEDAVFQLARDLALDQRRSGS